MPDHPVLTIAGCRVLTASFKAPDPTFRRLVEDCPNCSSTDTKLLTYEANTLPYLVYECRVCAHVWRFLQADTASVKTGSARLMSLRFRSSPTAARFVSLHDVR